MIVLSELEAGGRHHRIVDLPATVGAGLHRLPWLHRVFVENLLRRSDGDPQTLALVRAWAAAGRSDAEIAFYPARVMMHDTTCGPALVDLAACRSVLAEAGADPAVLNPVLPVDISTDHSLAVDVSGTPDALERNIRREFQRNGERYAFMKWAAGAMANLTVHPPGSGIMHTINLERLAKVVRAEARDGVLWAMPDTLIGTDSHTPMVNALGVAGWGVGGLEAESVMLGMPMVMRAPAVVGVRLTGRLGPAATATDVALVLTHRLRALKLDNRFLEFFGPGVSTLTVGDRGVLANMAPEYGSSSGYFPIDGHTLDYLRQVGRGPDEVELVELYARRQGLWFDPDAEPVYDEVLTLDLAEVGPSLAGPTRPQDLLSPSAVAAFARAGADGLPKGAVAIAAITSCTNTTDPRQLLAAGLLARKARERGLAPPSWVKTSLAPGSPTAARLLERVGLLGDLEAEGFAIVGYGCTTCIGNSGPLKPEAEAAVRIGAEPVAVLSGNRNFPGRVHGQLTQAFLASPALVVAYALAGDIDRDILRDPVGCDAEGRPVLLDELWPSSAEIDALLAKAWRTEDFDAAYGEARRNPLWTGLSAASGALYPWDDRSTYLRRPPFVARDAGSNLGAWSALPLLVLGDDITTDHISPAGAVPRASEAAAYLVAHGEDPADLNVFSARRGNWEAMVRGLFTNPGVRNQLADGLRPGQTLHVPSGEILPLWEAAQRYQAEGEPVVIVAGERYGMGSSRDWAAKGVRLLGARAVLALSFERIHRSNLVNMGVLPLLLPADRGPQALALQLGDRIEIDALPERLAPRAPVKVTVRRRDGRAENFDALAAVETALEIEVLRTGGILPLILQRALPAG
ncbi:MAG TPA: aconitate hydratase AcnA [Caulobacteraceae bacterium]